MSKDAKHAWVAVLGGLVAFAIVAYIGLQVSWSNEEGDPIDDYYAKGKCSKDITSGADKSADDPFTDVDKSNSVGLGSTLRIGDLSLVAYQGLSTRHATDAPAGGTRVLSADGEKYLSLSEHWIADVTVSRDGQTAVIVSAEAKSKKLGIVDLRDGSLDWLKLPATPTSVEASPVDDTVAVGTHTPGTALLVTPAAKTVEKVSLSSPMDEEEPLVVWWTNKADGLIAFSDDPPDGSVHDLDGTTKQRLTKDMGDAADGPDAAPGLSPSGNKVRLSWTSIDIGDKGSGVLEPLEECRHDGVVHNSSPVAWLDDDHFVAIEHEESFGEASGLPGEIPDSDKPRGQRLVTTDLDGNVQEVITDWGTPIPQSMWFTRNEQ